MTISQIVLLVVFAKVLLLRVSQAVWSYISPQLMRLDSIEIEYTPKCILGSLFASIWRERLVIYACGVTGYSERRQKVWQEERFFFFVQDSHLFVGFLFCILSNKDPKKSSLISVNLILVAQTSALV